MLHEYTYEQLDSVKVFNVHNIYTYTGIHVLFFHHYHTLVDQKKKIEQWIIMIILICVYNIQNSI